MSNASRTILVIEQDPMVRDLLCEILDSNGFLALSSDHCIPPDDVCQLRPDAVLVDPFMAGEPSGWGYLRGLRGHAGLDTLPIVLCTGAHERLREATSADLDVLAGTVLKPFDIDELLDAIAAATESRPAINPFPLLAGAEPEASHAPD